MARLELRFFGTPRFHVDGEPVALDRRKAEALIAFLVLEPGAHRRSELALLLWPELSAPKGRAALRRTLRTVTAALGRSWLAIERQSLAARDDASLWCDVIAFEHARASGDHESAVRLYRDDLLSALTLSDADGFDAWQRFRAERLRTEVAVALSELVRSHFEQGDDERAMAYAERWMSLDPFDERSHERAMEILIGSGRRGAALRLFDAFASRLEDELGIDPPQSMVDLRRARRPAASDRLPGFDDTAAAWRDACLRRRADVIDDHLDRVFGFADKNGFYHAGITLLDDAFTVVSSGPALGRLLSRQAVLYACVGQLAKARALLEASLRFARSEEEIAFCENRLGGVVFAEGEYERGRRYLRSSARRYRKAGDDAGLSWTLNVLGHLSIGTPAAPKILSESLLNSRRARDEPRLASTLNSLGKDAYVRGDWTTARRDLTKSLELRRALGHRIGIADSLNNLGGVLVGLGDKLAARRAFEEALEIAGAIRTRPLIAEILIGLASLRHAHGELEPAVRLAAAAFYLPGGWRDAKDRASEWLDALSAVLPPKAVERARRSGREYDLR